MSQRLRIAVDLPWDASAHMGTGVYSETMVRALAETGDDAEILLITSPDAPRTIQLKNVIYLSAPSIHLRNEGFRQVSLPSMLEGLKADCLFAPATLLPMLKVCPYVTTVHDTTFLERPEYYSPGLVRYLTQWFGPTLRAADQIVAISDETKAALQREGESDERITVIPQPVRDAFRFRVSEASVASTLAELKVTAPFFFHVSNLAPHKNLKFAMEVFKYYLDRHSSSKHIFVVAGGGIAPDQPSDPIALARQHGLSERVKLLGRVNDVALKALYQGCDALLFPSLAEGWGLPVAEANGLGTRVLASPHVPAAPAELRLELDVSKWAQALAAPFTKPQENGSVESASNAGRKLFDVLRRSVESSKSAVSVQRPLLPRNQHIRGIPRTENTGISGCTIVRNGVSLRYPFEESVASYAPICDEIIVCWDPTSTDGTQELVKRIATRFPQVKLVENVWNLDNRDGGSELAHQTQVAFKHCTRPWTLYIQADEAIHERDHAKLVALARDETLAGLCFERRSFFRTLDQEIPEHHTPAVVRMFRTGFGCSIGDAMHCRVDGHKGRVIDSRATFFNYSRMGTEDDIRVRSDNLNRFYHDDATVAELDPDRNKHWKTAPYGERHPSPIETRYRGKSLIPKRDESHEINVIFTVDDIRPESGCGLELESGSVAMLRDLHQEFGCKFTLFMPTNYYGRLDLRDHRQWFQQILDADCFEVACHGHHHWNLVPKRGDMEYLFQSTDDARWCIQRSLAVFGELGVRPSGVKAPGWQYTPEALPAIEETFEYQADHFVGTKWDTNAPSGLARLPYTRCIHEPMDDLLDSNGSIIVLHSHLGAESGKHDNGWTSANHQNVRRFLRSLLERNGDAVGFVTAAESLATHRIATQV